MASKAGSMSALPGTSATAYAQENIRLREHELGRAGALCQANAPTSSIFFRWGGASSKASPIAPTIDLKQHSQFSGKALEYFDEESKQKIVPYVIEPSAGADRSTLAFLVDAYQRGRGQRRKARRSEISSRAGADQDRGAAAAERTIGSWRQQRNSPLTCVDAGTLSTTTRHPSVVSIGAKTKWARLSALPSTSRRWATKERRRMTKSRFAIAIPWSRFGFRCRRLSPPWKSSWPESGPRWRKSTASRNHSFDGSWTGEKHDTGSLEG